jgi:hypothetical protein
MIITIGFVVQDVQHPNQCLKIQYLYCKNNLIKILDLMYFWCLDMIQPKVSKQANKLSHNTMWHWFGKFCILAGKIMKKENPTRMIGGLGHFVQIDESKFSKRKFHVGRILRSPWIVFGIDYTSR